MITWVITHHFTLPIIHLFNPLKKLCTTTVFNFSWVFTVVRREIEDNAYAKLGWGGGGDNEAYYGQREKVEYRGLFSSLRNRFPEHQK